MSHIHGIESSGALDVRKHIAGRLVQECERLGISNKRAAEMSGCSRRTWSYYLSGTTIPDAEILSALDHRGFDVLYIVTGRRTTRKRRSSVVTVNMPKMVG